MFYQTLYRALKKKWRINLKTTIAVLNKKGENTTHALIDALKAMHPEKNAQFGIITPSMKATEIKIDKLCRQKLNSSIAFGYAVSASNSLFELYIEKCGDSTIALEGATYAPTTETSLIKIKESRMDCTKTAKEFLSDAEGEFSLKIIEPNKIIAARDAIGVKPLYYGENTEVAVLASNLKSFWNLGIEEPKSFPPGNLAVLTSKGFKFEPVKTLTSLRPELTTLEDAARSLQDLLEYSVKIRVHRSERVGVAFSGGLDSSVVACLAKKYCSDVQLIHVSLENQPETEDAWKAAEELDLPIQIHLFKESEVEKTIPRVLEIIEDPEPLKINVGIPLYWVAEKASEAKIRILLAGQGADELFGGYQRYVKQYLLQGDEKVRETFFKDVLSLYETNIERDEKIFAFHDVSLRLPFASFGIAKFALGLPTELKFENKPDSLRKLVLRKMAKNVGIPETIAQRPKKAVQYSTGISDFLKKLAKKHNITLGQYLNEIFQKQKEYIISRVSVK